LAVSSSALRQSVPIALSISLSASVPGIRFEGNVSRGSSQEPTGIVLHLTRATDVIAVSLIVMLMMTAERVDLLPLSVSISLIFGLPALRNIQPGVPPVGALVDNVMFIWAELIVAASAVIIVWTWLLRTRAEP
jgi:hypothetical protein